MRLLKPVAILFISTLFTSISDNSIASYNPICSPLRQKKEKSHLIKKNCPELFFKAK